MKNFSKEFWLIVFSVILISGIAYVFFFMQIEKNVTRNDASIFAVFNKPCNPKISKCGTIRIVKDSVPDNYQEFVFNHNVPGYPSSFSLDDDGTLTNPSPLPNYKVLYTSPNGQFYVNENPNPNFIVQISCSDPTGDTVVSQNMAMISISNAEAVTCIFTNKKKDSFFSSGKNSCEVSDAWVQVSDFVNETFNRTSFSINGKVYATLGLAGGVYQNDLWEYDPGTDAWTQKANFPGESRIAGVGFSINNIGYVSTGYNGDFFNDLWAYNPATDTWTQKANFPGSARSSAEVFVIGNIAYVGLGGQGQESYFNDLWAYNPATDTWTQKANFPGNRRAGSVGFSINNIGYVATGQSIDVSYPHLLNDLWAYNPTTDTWTQKANLPGPTRHSASSFALNGKGYVTTGYHFAFFDTVFLNDLWEYNPLTDTWTQKAGMPGEARMNAFAEALNDTAYVGTGDYTWGITNDVWRYCP